MTDNSQKGTARISRPRGSAHSGRHLEAAPGRDRRSFGSAQELCMPQAAVGRKVERGCGRASEAGIDQYHHRPTFGPVARGQPGKGAWHDIEIPIYRQRDGQAGWAAFAKPAMEQ